VTFDCVVHFGDEAQPFNRKGGMGMAMIMETKSFLMSHFITQNFSTQFLIKHHTMKTCGVQSALEGEWLASRSSLFTPGESATGTHWKKAEVKRNFSYYSFHSLSRCSTFCNTRVMRVV